MPDGDVVHSKLRACFWGPYKQICGLDDFNPEATAHDLALPLKKDIDRIAEKVAHVISDGITVLKQLPQEPLLKQGIDYGQVSRYIDKLAQQCPIDHRSMELVKNSLKRQLDNFRHDNVAFDAQDAVRDCFLGIYDDQFAGRVPLKAKHLNGTDFSTIEQRLGMMREYVVEEMSKFAKDTIAHKSRRRRAVKRQKGNLYGAAY